MEEVWQEMGVGTRQKPINEWWACWIFLDLNKYGQIVWLNICVRLQNFRTFKATLCSLFFCCFLKMIIIPLSLLQLINDKMILKL